MALQDALLIIDLQNGVCHGVQPVANLAQVVTGVNQRIKRYRAAQRPVIFVQHTDADLLHGQPDWQLLAELDVRATDHFVEKTHANSFYHTNLQAQLTTLGVRSLEIAGAQTEYCVDTTIKMAHGLGYQLQLVQGLTTTTANPFMSAQATIDFYERRIWKGRFLTLVTVLN